MAFVKIKPRRGTNAEWEAANPILENGELGIVVPDTGTGTGTIKMKIGDGVHNYTSLPYALDLSTFTPGGGGGVVTNIGLFVDRNNWILTDGIYKNTIDVTGITADCYPQFTLIPANGEYPTNEEVLAFNYIDDLVTGEGTITFRARTLPISSIAILVKDDAGTGDNVIANYAELVSKLNSAESNISNLQSSVEDLTASLTTVEGTLAIGATSITLSDPRLTTTSNIIPMTSKWGVNPLTITKSVGQVVMTFPVQTEIIKVGVEIHG